ncbi:MAG: PEP-CTERM sorting domain-containing protein [Verrucomicrobiota bacterium JB024]|nr:PEP-CTERM sorting domain-containing protein [Verrucomicrobiota bacterium JB024]
MHTRSTATKTLLTAAALSTLLLADTPLYGGIYAGPVGASDTTAITMNSDAFVGWATGIADYTPGEAVSDSYSNATAQQRALGTAVGGSGDILCLGRGGSVTLTFANAIFNGDGYDFAIFENSFSDTFLELGYVEVSSDGEHFTRFATHSLTESAVGGFGNVDPTNIDGFAGKYRAGYGTPFDLSDLVGQTNYEYLDLNNILYVRIVDVIGDGSEYDSYGNAIYDPYPTTGSAGFDLDAVGVFYAVPEPATYAAFAGLGALALVFLRRRSSATRR